MPYMDSYINPPEFIEVLKDDFGLDPEYATFSYVPKAYPLEVTIQTATSVRRAIYYDD